MTTLADLQALAIEIAKARAEASAPGEHEVRLARMDAVRERYRGRMPVIGVSVYAIMPQSRLVYRRPHYRFQYYVNGTRSNEAAARKALEGASP